MSITYGPTSGRVTAPILRTITGGAVTVVKSTTMICLPIPCDGRHASSDSQLPRQTVTISITNGLSGETAVTIDALL